MVAQGGRAVSYERGTPVALPHSGWPTVLELTGWVCGAHPSTVGEHRAWTREIGAQYSATEHCRTHDAHACSATCTLLLVFASRIAKPCQRHRLRVDGLAGAHLLHRDAALPAHHLRPLVDPVHHTPPLPDRCLLPYLPPDIPSVEKRAKVEMQFGSARCPAERMRAASYLPRRRVAPTCVRHLSTPTQPKRHRSAASAGCRPAVARRDESQQQDPAPEHRSRHCRHREQLLATSVH